MSSVLWTRSPCLRSLFWYDLDIDDLFDHFSSGSGLRNVRGLLRRSEARIMIERMQHGEVKPGEVKELLRQGKERLQQQQQS